MNGGRSHQCTCSWYLLNSPVDHIYNNAVHIYDNGLSISSNPVFLNFFPIYTNSVFFPSPVSGQLQLRRGHLIRGPKVSSHQSLRCIFFIGIAKEYILGVHSTSISAVKTKMGEALSGE